MNRGLVSVISPICDSVFIGEAIESVLAQSYAAWEMIIVDDCSSDGGAGIAVVNSYAGRDSRIRLIASGEKRGSSGARNIALRAARGRYVAFLDSDDLWHPDFLERQLSFMERNGAFLVFSSYRRIDETAREEVLPPFAVPPKADYRSLLKTCPIFLSTAIYDTSKIEKIYFNEALGSLRDDYVYWLSMLREGGCAYGNPEVLADYRLRKNSVTADKRRVVGPQWNVLRKVERLSLIRSAYCLCCWAVTGYFKYRR